MVSALLFHSPRAGEALFDAPPAVEDPVVVAALSLGLWHADFHAIAPAFMALGGLASWRKFAFSPSGRGGRAKRIPGGRPWMFQLVAVAIITWCARRSISRWPLALHRQVTKRATRGEAPEFCKSTETAPSCFIALNFIHKVMFMRVSAFYQWANKKDVELELGVQMPALRHVCPAEIAATKARDVLPVCGAFPSNWVAWHLPSTKRCRVATLLVHVCAWGAGFVNAYPHGGRREGSSELRTRHTPRKSRSSSCSRFYG